jgi:ribosomal RNA-processing protein 17
MRDERKKEVEEMAKALHDEARKAAAFARGINESDMESDEEDELTAPTTAAQIEAGEDEFVDEELDGEQKLSTVRIEPMDLDASSSSEEESGSDQEENGKEKDKRKNNMEKKKKSDKPKVKKKKFRYLTASERKQDRRKIREKKDKFKERRAAEKGTSGSTRKKR